jgi:hypothetical protein
MMILRWRLRTLVLLVAVFGLIFGAEVFVSKRSPEELNFNVFVLGIAGVFVGLRAMFWFIRTATPIRTRRSRWMASTRNLDPGSTGYATNDLDQTQERMAR